MIRMIGHGVKWKVRDEVRKSLSLINGETLGPVIFQGLHCPHKIRVSRGSPVERKFLFWVFLRQQQKPF